MEQGDIDTTSASEEYRTLLRKHRMKRGLTHAALAPQIPCSESLLGHVERGTRPPTESFTRGAEKALGLDGELLELLPGIRSDLSPKWFRRWPAIEQAAASIRTYEVALVPGLLQTADYARAIFSGEPGATSAEVDKQMKVRLQRQAILEQASPPTLSFLLDESALLRHVGGREVMKDQLAHLLAMAARPCVTVRVVPLASAATAGLAGGFALADLGGGEQAGYIDNIQAGEVTRQPDIIRGLASRWEILSGLAQPTYVTEQIIRKALESE